MSNAYRPGLRSQPWIVWALAAAMAASFLLTGQYDPDRHQDIFNLLAIVPALFDPAQPDHYANWLDALVPLFGHPFAHYGWLHIIINLMAYAQAAPFLAGRLGVVRFLGLFIVSTLGGALAFIALDLHADTAAVGASGAICGLFGAYFLAVRPTPRAALADPIVRNAIISFLGGNVVLMGILAAMHILPIAWQAHLGGFVAGGLFYLAFGPKLRPGPWS